MWMRKSNERFVLGFWAVIKGIERYDLVKTVLRFRFRLRLLQFSENQVFGVEIRRVNQKW